MGLFMALPIEVAGKGDCGFVRTDGLVLVAACLTIQLVCSYARNTRGRDD
jgi:hypothetical protein